MGIDTIVVAGGVVLQILVTVGGIAYLAGRLDGKVAGLVTQLHNQAGEISMVKGNIERLRHDLDMLYRSMK
jgi:hypothetical protein